MSHILLVEDDPSCRELLRHLCEMQGHRVSAVTEARHALIFMGIDRQQPRATVRPDLIILDFGLGAGINGYQLAAVLRQREELRRLPLIMVSGTTKQIRDLIELEGVYFVRKPFETTELVETVEKALGTAPKPPVRAFPALQPAPVTPRRAMTGLDFFLPEPSPLAIAPLSDQPLPPAALERVLSPKPVPLAVKPAAPRPAPPPPPIVERFERPAKSPPPAPPAPPARLEASIGESPVADLVNQIVMKALGQGASDIHFEPQRDCLCVRTRVDGVLQPLGRLPAEALDKVAVRIKILCNLNITEKRLPQDGQFSVRKPGGEMAKFRVSTLPSMYGEKIVIRLLSADTLQVKLDSMGFSAKSRAQIQDVLKRPTGLILATGPTGSGKTTTLYTLLDMLNSPQRNIVTVEDPVEYQLPGITQVQVNAGIGYSFDRVLRALLRQDPNVILIGEIRDAETAEIALKAAVTGHMVLSTLHTNDAPSAVHRLLSMGLPDYLVAAACRMVISQRLIRLLCQECRAPGELMADETCQLTAEERRLFKKVWRPKGCPACHGIGYAGRKAMCEIMPMTSHRIHQAIIGQAAPDELRAAALEEGMTPMREEALRCAAEGLTSPEEAFKALYL